MVCSRLEIKRTHDMQLVKELWGDPRIYSQMTDDACPTDPADWHPKDDSRRYYLVPYLDSIPIGIIAYYALSACLFEVHIGILPEYQHQYSVALGQLSFSWMFENTSCQKIIGFVPENRPAALQLAIKVGMQQEGYLRNSFLSQRTLINQHLMSIGREEHVRNIRVIG